MFHVFYQIFDHASNNQLVGTVTGLSRGVFSVDFSPVADVRPDPARAPLLFATSFKRRIDPALLP